MSNMVGIDIGTTEVRVVKIAGVDAAGFALVTNVGVAPVPFGSVSAGRIRDPKEVSVALVRAIREAGVSRRGFVLGLGSPDISLQRMALPTAVRKEEREPAIRALGRALAPTFELDQTVISTQLLDKEVEGDGMQMSTLSVAAAHTTDIEALNDVCELARCTPRAIDISGAALLRSLTRANPQYGEVSTVVDIGASKATVATRQGHHLRSVRTTAGAGVEMSRSLAQALGCTFEEAEDIKRTVRLPAVERHASGGYASELSEEDTVTPAERIISQSVNMVVDAVAQSIEADASNFGSYTQGVTLCGGTVLLRGLKDRLQRRIGVPVIIGKPWAEVERSRRNASFFVDGKVDPRVLLSLSTAVGLALWKEPL